MMRTRLMVEWFAFLCFTAALASAGGPLYVGGPAVGSQPAYGVDGEPFTWNPAKMPIAYRVDPGPMAVNPSGTTVIDHATGLQRLQSMFGVWQGVSTASNHQRHHLFWRWRFHVAGRERHCPIGGRPHHSRG